MKENPPFISHTVWVETSANGFGFGATGNEWRWQSFTSNDVIWMPLYADDQVIYDSYYEAGTSDKDQVSSVQIEAADLENDLDEGWTVAKVGNNKYCGLKAEPLSR